MASQIIMDKPLFQGRQSTWVAAATAGSIAANVIMQGIGSAVDAFVLLQQEMHIMSRAEQKNTVFTRGRGE
jgi:hypothetical protein